MILNEFTGRLMKYYRLDFNEGVTEESWFRDLAEMFGDTPPEILARACSDIIKTKKTPFFPLPAEIEEAIKQAKQNIALDESRARFARDMEDMRQQQERERVERKKREENQAAEAAAAGRRRKTADMLIAPTSIFVRFAKRDGITPEEARKKYGQMSVEEAKRDIGDWA